MQELIDFIGESDFLASMIDKRDRFHVIDTGDIFTLIHLLTQKNPQIKFVKFLDEGCNNLDDVREIPTADGITREIFHVSEEQLTDPKYKQNAFFGGKSKKSKKSKKLKKWNLTIVNIYNMEIFTLKTPPYVFIADIIYILDVEWDVQVLDI